MLRYLLTYLYRLQSEHRNIIEKHGVKMHLYADNTQLYDHLRVYKIERSVAALEACLQDIGQWSSQRRLKLNPSKTELIWFSLNRGHSIEKLQQQPLIRLNSQELSSSPSVRDLGVIIDSDLTPSWQERVSISCEEFDWRRKTWTKTLSKVVSPCTCSLTSGLLQLGTGQLARSDACTTYSYPALRCTA